MTQPKLTREEVAEKWLRNAYNKGEMIRPDQLRELANQMLRELDAAKSEGQDNNFDARLDAAVDKVYRKYGTDLGAFFKDALGSARPKRRRKR